MVHVKDDRVIPYAGGQGLADGIPGARLVTFQGIDHAYWLFDGLVDEVERFVTGAVSRTEPNRVLTSVLFTDIVGSTTHAAELGDRAWQEVLERHDELVESTVSEHGGRVVKHIGDGALSAFDGPAMAMRCAETLNEGVAELGIRLRSGVRTGECEAKRVDRELAVLTITALRQERERAGKLPPGSIAQVCCTLRDDDSRPGTPSLRTRPTHHLPQRRTPQPTPHRHRSDTASQPDGITGQTFCGGTPHLPRRPTSVVSRI